MTRTTRIRSTAAVAGAVIGAVVLAGCSAGQITQTSRQVTAVDGANANAGPIGVRNAHFVLPEHVESAVAYPRGGSAPLQLVIVNSGNTADELVSVTSPIAGSGEVTGKRDVPAGRTIFVEGEPAAEAAAAAPTATPTAAAGATPSATAGRPTPTPTSAPTTSAEALLPGESGTAKIVLTGLRDDIKSGITYEVVLNFRNAGPLRLAVPVAGSEAERKDEAGH